MKLILSLLAISISLTFAAKIPQPIKYKESDFYGVWNLTGKMKDVESFMKFITTNRTLEESIIVGALTSSQFGFVIFDKNGECAKFSYKNEQLNCSSWRFRNGGIEITNSNTNGDIVSNKEIDFHIKYGSEGQVVTLKKAGDLKQAGKFFTEMKKQKEKEKLSCKSNTTSAFCYYQNEVGKIYAKADSVLAKGEFETEEDYKKRMPEILSKLKSNAQYFCKAFKEITYSSFFGKDCYSELMPIKYNADEQSYEIQAIFPNNARAKALKGKTCGIPSSGKVKMPVDMAKQYKEKPTSFYMDYPEYYITPDFSLVLKSIAIYDYNGVEHSVVFDVPSDAKKISLNCSEIMSSNPYAKEHELLFSDFTEQKKKEYSEAREKHYYATYEFDGESYNAINMNGTVWLAKNMNRATPNSGCYDDKPENCGKYGRLYNFEEAQNVCPADWHLPTEKDWQQLKDYIGFKQGDERIAATKLKTLYGWTFVYNDIKNGSDYYGFAALPGGYFYKNDSYKNVIGDHVHSSFEDLGITGNWWLSNGQGSIGYEVKNWELKNGFNGSEERFLSVRCVMNKKAGE